MASANSSGDTAGGNAREPFAARLQQVPLNPQHFSTFLAVVDGGGRVSAAARALGLSQPGVTHQLNELERRLGMQLLDRGRGRAARVTRAGRVFERYARSIVGMQSAMFADLDQLHHDVGGVLRLGASSSAGETWLPALVCAFHEQHPNVRTQMQVGDSRSVVEQVSAGELELGVVAARWNVPELQFDAVRGEALIAVAPAGHPLAERTGIAVDELAASARFVLQDQGSGLRATLERELAAHGVELARLDVVAELGGQRSIVEAVAHGGACGWVWRSSVEVDLAAGRLVELDLDAQLAGEHFLVRRASRRLSRRGTAFVDAIRRDRERASLEAESAESAR